jgi:hypothetical protein
MVNGYVQQNIIYWHDDHPDKTYTLSCTDDQELEELLETRELTANGVDTVFELDSEDHAYDFIRCSPDNETTWFYPSDYLLTWGSNSSDYTNETIDDDGYFAVNFTEIDINTVEIVTEEATVLMPIISSATLETTASTAEAVYLDVLSISGIPTIDNSSTLITTAAYDNYGYEGLTNGNNYLWNCYACGTDGNCSFAPANYSFKYNQATLLENSQTYNSSTYEDLPSTFKINISYI